MVAASDLVPATSAPAHQRTSAPAHQRLEVFVEGSVFHSSCTSWMELWSVVGLLGGWVVCMVVCLVGSSEPAHSPACGVATHAMGP